MVAPSNTDLPYFKGYGRQRGRGFGALAQTIGRTAIPFLRKYVVPAARRVGADLLEYAAPEIGEVLSGRKTVKSAARNVGKKTLRKQIGGGKRKKVIPQRTSTKNSRSRRDIFTNIGR